MQTDDIPTIDDLWESWREVPNCETDDLHEIGELWESWYEAERLENMERMYDGQNGNL